MFSASIVRNSRTVVNEGRLYIFINLSTFVRASISSTFCGRCQRVCWVEARQGNARTDGYWVVDVLRLDDVTQEHGRFFLTLYTFIVIEYNAWRIDDTQSSFKLYRLQFLRMSRLRRHRTHLFSRVRIKTHKKHEWKSGSPWRA